MSTKNQNERRSRKTATAGLCVVAASLLGVGVVADASGNDPVARPMTIAPAEVFSGISPVRLLDTRNGIGALAAGPFGPGETRTLAVAGFEDVPSNATSVAVNVTLPRSATSTSFVTLWPAGSSLPSTSTSNATPGQAVPNFTITALGDGGAINVFNERGDTHIVIDVVGFYAPMSPGTTSAALGGAMLAGLGAPSDDIGDNGDFYIEQVEADMYQKDDDTWGDPLIELATEADAMSGPHVIAADGAPTASDGDDGDVYIDTQTLEVYGPKSAGAWGVGQPIGPDGDGSAFFSAPGAPAASLGDDGDLYLDETSLDLFGPKTGGAWGTPVALDTGSDFFVGSGVPDDVADGEDGDMYLDQDSLVLYGPKAAGAWTIAASLDTGSNFFVDTGAPDDVADGEDGDMYLDDDSLTLYGPKAAGVWTVAASLDTGSNFLVGAGVPDDVADGDDGDMYLDQDTLTLHGPKSGGAWDAGLELGGSEVLTGTVPPTAADGDDGDLYIDTASLTLYGPKAGGAWPAVGTELDPGASLLTGVVPPTAADGVDGDIYVDTATLTVYGPKVAGAWPSGNELAPGIDLLAGSGAPGAGDGEDGDMYLDQDTLTLYGPKAGGAWPAVGADLDGPPTAASDSALSAYSDGLAITVAALSSVPISFDTDGVAVGTAISRAVESAGPPIVYSDDTFVFNAAGTYKVSYTIGASVTVGGSVDIVVDGVSVPGQTFSLGLGGVTSTTALVSVAAGDTLEIELSSVLGVTGTVDGSIVIELIAVD